MIGTAAPPIRTTLRCMLLAWIITMALGSLAVFSRLVAGDDIKQAFKSTSVLQARKLLLPVGLDSWGAMLAARYRLAQGPGASIYADTLQLDNCKFQYPPAALLVLDLLPAAPPGPHVCGRDAELSATLQPWAWAAQPGLDWASRLAFFGTLLLAALILREGLRRGAAGAAVVSRRHSVLLSCLAGLLGLTFFPLTWGYELGQIQVFLNLLVALALFAALRGRTAAAGALLGLCCLFKPQYAVVGIWALLRREGRLGGALFAVAGAGFALALWRYGLAAHLEYLDLLSGLSRLGEGYWPNQSVNGLLNRFLLTGPPLQWADSAFGSNMAPALTAGGGRFEWSAMGFPRYDPLVHGATVLSSLAIIGVALWPPAGRPHPLRLAADLATIIAASTLASPIAWHHHYGAFFALFALALAAAVAGPPRRPAFMVVLGLAYLLLAQVFLQPERLFVNPWLGLLGSHAWLGAMLLGGVLLVLRGKLPQVAAQARPVDVKAATQSVA